MPERLCMSELYDRVRHCWTSVLRHMFHGGANICHLRHVRPDVDAYATGQKTLTHDAGFRHVRIEAIPKTGLGPCNACLGHSGHTTVPKTCCVYAQHIPRHFALAQCDTIAVADRNA